MLRFIAAAAEQAGAGGQRLPRDHQQRPRRRPGGTSSALARRRRRSPGEDGVNRELGIDRGPHQRGRHRRAARRRQAPPHGAEHLRRGAQEGAHRRQARRRPARPTSSSFSSASASGATRRSPCTSRAAAPTSPSRRATRRSCWRPTCRPQLGDDELRALVDEAVAETGAASPKEMGKVMGALMPRVAGRADGKRLSELVRERLGALTVADRVRITDELESNGLALSLAGEHDAHLKILEQRLDCTRHAARQPAHLRGHARTTSKRRRRRCTSCSRVIRSGPRREPADGRVAHGHRRQRRRQAVEVYGDVVLSHRGRQIGPRTVNQKVYVDADPHQHDHLRHRPGRHRQDVSRHGHGRAGVARPRPSGASSSRDPPSRPGRASAFCPARSRRRSTPTSGRCSTRSTT